MSDRLASTMLPGFHETAEKFFSHDQAVEPPPPHLTSEYFKTLSQQEKEQAWEKWAERCYKYMKEREEADKYFGREVNIFRECVNKYLEGDINMKSMDFEELKKIEWDRYNKAHEDFDKALFRFNEAEDDNFYTKQAALRVIMDCSKSMYGALKSLNNIYQEIDDKEALDDYRTGISGVCEGE